MEVSVAKRLYVHHADVPGAVTVPVLLGESNAVQIAGTIYSIGNSGKSINAALQVSNDLENWRDVIGGDVNLNLGYTLGSVVAEIASRYVRVRLDSELEGQWAVVALTLVTSSQ